jgi:hypothetical protein
MARSCSELRTTHFSTQCSHGACDPDGADASCPAFSFNDLGAKLDQKIMWTSIRCLSLNRVPTMSTQLSNLALTWRESKAIKIHGESNPKSCMTFEEASIHEFVLNDVDMLGFSCANTHTELRLVSSNFCDSAVTARENAVPEMEPLSVSVARRVQAHRQRLAGDMSSFSLTARSTPHTDSIAHADALSIRSWLYLNEIWLASVLLALARLLHFYCQLRYTCNAQTSWYSVCLLLTLSGTSSAAQQ